MGESHYLDPLLWLLTARGSSQGSLGVGIAAAGCNAHSQRSLQERVKLSVWIGVYPVRVITRSIISITSSYIWIHVMAGVDHSTRFDGLGPSTNIGTSIDSGSKRISPTRERIAKHEGKSVVARWECRRRLE